MPPEKKKITQNVSLTRKINGLKTQNSTKEAALLQKNPQNFREHGKNYLFSCF